MNSLRERYIFDASSSSSFEKISDGLLDAIALVSVCHEIDIGCAMPENATFQNLRLWLLPLREQLPLGAAREESLDSAGRAPIQVMVWILAVAEFGGHGNDPLVYVVGQGDENVDSPRRALSENAWEGEDEESQGEHSAVDNCLLL